MSADDSKKLNCLYEHFKNHVKPTLNLVFARYKFNNEVQGNTTTLSPTFCANIVPTQIQTRWPGTAYSVLRGMPQDKGKAHQRRQRTTWLDKAIEISQNFEYSQDQLSPWETTRLRYTPFTLTDDLLPERHTDPVAKTPRRRFRIHPTKIYRTAQKAISIKICKGCEWKMRELCQVTWWTTNFASLKYVTLVISWITLRSRTDLY